MVPQPIRVVLLGVTLAFVGGSLISRLADARLPGNNTGHAPVQPLAYSHRLHAGELGIDCSYCHMGASRGRHAAIPSADVCMACHRSVRASQEAVKAEEQAAAAEGRTPRTIVSAELAKLYAALGLDDQLRPDPQATPSPIPWKQVHVLPEHAHFDHSVHMATGLKCQQCHGPIETMERVRQQERLSMGWCIECHRAVNRDGVGGQRVAASLDCAACHY